MATEVLADEEALRKARRCRALAAMAEHDIDVLMLGREANARYVAGAPRLWTAGTRPFGPGCVMLRDGAVHLVSTWDEGIPEDIPHERLFGITWNPGNLLSWLRGIEGVAQARRIGTDSLTPRFAQLLAKTFPSAELVDAEQALEAARRIKTAEEIDAIRASIAVCESAIAAAVAELRPGVTERHLAAAFMDAMARHGVTTPATQRVASISTGCPPNHKGRGRRVSEEDLVIFDAGVVAAGYASEVGRTWPAGVAARGAARLYAQCEELWESLARALRPGASCAELLDAYGSAGIDLPALPIATGLGLGFDPPVVTGDLRRTAERERLAPGMVLAVTAMVGQEGSGAVVRKEAVLVTEAGPEILTSSPHWRA